MTRLFNRTSTNRVSLSDSMKNFCKQGVGNQDFISTTYGGTISSPRNDADQKTQRRLFPLGENREEKVF